MEFIRTLREKHQTKRQAEIELKAEELITLADFNDSIYIAYNGTPLAPIDPSWTTKEIVQQLSIFRKNFINSRLKDEGLHKRLAAL
jgi:hypothetical protein